MPMVLEDRLIPMHTVHLSRARARRPAGPAERHQDHRRPTAVAPGTTFTVIQWQHPAGRRDTPVDSDGRFEVDVPLSFGEQAGDVHRAGHRPELLAEQLQLGVVRGRRPPERRHRHRAPSARRGSPAAACVDDSRQAGRRRASHRRPTPARRRRPEPTARTGSTPTSRSGVNNTAGGRLDHRHARRSIGPTRDRSRRTTSRLGALRRRGHRRHRHAPDAGRSRRRVANLAAIAGTVTDAENGLPVAGATRRAVGRRAAADDGGRRHVHGSTTSSSGTTAQTASDATVVDHQRPATGTRRPAVKVRKDQTSTFAKAHDAEAYRHRRRCRARPGDRRAAGRGEGQRRRRSRTCGRRRRGTLQRQRRDARSAQRARCWRRSGPTLAGYWQRSITVQVSDGATTTADVAMLKECATAEVRGLVVNAETRAADRPAPRWPATTSATATTGADGRFAITDIRMQVEQHAVVAQAHRVGQRVRQPDAHGQRVLRGTHRRRLRLAAGVAGGAHRHGDRPRHRARRSATSSSAPASAAATRTAADGTYRIEEVPTNDDGTPGGVGRHGAAGHRRRPPAGDDDDLGAAGGDGRRPTSRSTCRRHRTRRRRR